jgi:uncharacterized membrane protein YedE/YeeE
MPVLIAAVAGLVFGLGLLLSGMADPAKVLAFLDLAGAWDPSLALVMAGAIGVAVLAFEWAGRRDRSMLGEPMHLPSAIVIDGRLVLGSTLFGVGWGLAGFCPGPALVALGLGEPKAGAFVLAMLIGMVLFEGLERLRSRAAA